MALRGRVGLRLRPSRSRGLVIRPPPPPPAPLARLAATTGRALSDLMDDYNERAGHRELCMSKDAAELAAVSDVLSLYEGDADAK